MLYDDNAIGTPVYEFRYSTRSRIGLFGLVISVPGTIVASALSFAAFSGGTGCDWVGGLFAAALAVCFLFGAGNIVFRWYKPQKWTLTVFVDRVRWNAPSGMMEIFFDQMRRFVIDSWGDTGRVTLELADGGSVTIPDGCWGDLKELAQAVETIAVKQGFELVVNR